MSASMLSSLFTTFLFLFLLLSQSWVSESLNGGGGFVRTRGTEFVVDGHTLYVNGFNSYFLTYAASDPNTRPSLSLLLHQAASAGLSVARTWAFNDGNAYHSIQTSPGVFNQNSFQAMDFVLHEANRNGLRLILSLSNNYASMGGKAQYVQWARNAGLSLSSDDAFFYDPTVKTYFKNYIKAVLTRVNSITGVAYKDDPTIFAWELMNEARCERDASGNTLQAWIQEMAAYVKSIDSNHMLEIGLEGFYGFHTPARQSANPGGFGAQLGTDFIRNNEVHEIDFVSVHSYPDQWLPYASFEQQLSFLRSWINAHLEDAQTLRKPVLFTEFGISSKDSGFYSGKRQIFFSTMYELMYSSARSGGPAAGALFWQLLPQSLLSTLDDGYAIDLSQDSSMAHLITLQSQKMAELKQLHWRRKLLMRASS